MMTRLSMLSGYCDYKVRQRNAFLSYHKNVIVTREIAYWVLIHIVGLGLWQVTVGLMKNK